MFRSLRTILAFVFLVWLMPLGIFIAPSKEKLVCDGQRAMCMCSGKISKASAEAGVTVKSASGVPKEQNASGGGIHAYTGVLDPFALAFRKDYASGEIQSLYSDPSISLLDPVPKA